MGVDRVRFKPTHQPQPLDCSSPSLVRNPNKCILCGDCVRACDEIQGIGAIDFAYRSAQASVVPAFGKGLAEGECVNCGLCARCAHRALTPRQECDDVWKALNDPKKTVIAQIAPAVRVALGGLFGMAAGRVETGRIAAALKAHGFQGGLRHELCRRLDRGGRGQRVHRPQDERRKITAVHLVLSGMGEIRRAILSGPTGETFQLPVATTDVRLVARKILPERMNVAAEDVVIVSIMPCTAKKFEARLPKFATNGRPDVDFVLTTQELARMIEEAGLRFDQIEPQSLDMPLGFKTGAGVIFGASGGVTEAVLRYAVEKLRESRWMPSNSATSAATGACARRASRPAE